MYQVLLFNVGNLGTFRYDMVDRCTLRQTVNKFCGVVVYVCLYTYMRNVDKASEIPASLPSLNTKITLCTVTTICFVVFIPNSGRCLTYQAVLTLRHMDFNAIVRVTSLHGLFVLCHTYFWSSLRFPHVHMVTVVAGDLINHSYLPVIWEL